MWYKARNDLSLDASLEFVTYSLTPNGVMQFSNEAIMRQQTFVYYIQLL